MKKFQRSSLAIALLLVSLVGLSAAQAPVRRVVIKAGQLLDVKAGQTLQDQAIVIENDKIVSVGPFSNANTTNATVIDLSHATVLPG